MIIIIRLLYYLFNKKYKYDISFNDSENFPRGLLLSSLCLLLRVLHVILLEWNEKSHCRLLCRAHTSCTMMQC